MKTYSLEYGWGISFPESWTSDMDEQGTRRFYPSDDPTTAYAAALHAEKQGVPAPVEVMIGAFMNTLPENVKEIPPAVEKLPCKAFFSVDDRGIFRISAGFFAEGELLMLNVYSENEAAVWDALEYFKSVTFNG